MQGRITANLRLINTSSTSAPPLSAKPDWVFLNLPKPHASRGGRFRCRFRPHGRMGSKQASWSWCGTVHDEAKSANYRGLLVVNDADDSAAIHLSDDKNSFTGNATHTLLASPSDSTIASTSPETRFEKVRDALDASTDGISSTSKGEARVVTEAAEDGMADEARHELRVSACWGAEFGLSDVLVDVAAVPLRRRKGNGEFLDAAFARVKSSREKIAGIEEEERTLAVEIEDLAEAHRCLEETQTEENKRKRMQTLVDELNKYKRMCRERAGVTQRKEKSIVQKRT